MPRLGALLLSLLLAAPLALSAQDSGGTSGSGTSSGGTSGGGATVPRSPILTIDSERLLLGSLFGRRIQREYEADSAVLAAENRRIEAELIAEEQELTEQRAQMTPEAFRALADAFDEKVQRIRREQDAKTRRLSQSGDTEQAAFFEAIAPVLERIMAEAGAAVILEQRSVFLSQNIIDITDAAVQAVDAAIGDGSGLELRRTAPAPDPQEPDAQDAGEPAPEPEQ